LTSANNLDPDEDPQNVGPHLRSKLFSKILEGYNEFLSFERKEMENNCLAYK